MLQVSRPSGSHRAPRPSRAGRRMGRVLLLAAGVAVAGSTVPASAQPAPVRFGDHLTVVVDNVGGGVDGRYVLRCHPDGGSHPQVSEACDLLDRETVFGRDLFAPVPDGSLCTMQYGGPATAHVTGTWAGRPVDARFGRGNGCEIARWDRLMPLLPAVGERAVTAR
ncbi:SSI family serine proteinase inhibitor [Streptomyces sp. DI166]|uniref:SSI family serine proteinase inhibitor n=1 Tax=Streptomyces sp. DI166 TaxID=1839783 RepID=UPI000B80FE2D